MSQHSSTHGEASIGREKVLSMSQYPSTYPPAPEETKAEAATSRRQVYALVGLFMVSVLVIGIVLAILSLGVGSGGVGGGILTQKVVITHTPVTKSSVGADIEIAAKVTGLPKNVTLSYTVLPNNVTSDLIHNIAPKNVYMLLISSGGDQYSYTIRGSEVIGDITYHIAAVDAYGNGAQEPTRKIKVDDFTVVSPAKQLYVFISQAATTTVTVQSFYDFSSPVTLRAKALGLDTLPGGLTAEFNPSTVTPPKSGAATSTLTIRATSRDFIPAGTYYIKTDGWVSTAGGTIVRNSSIAVLNVPDFSFDVTPSSQTVVRSSLSDLTEKITPYDLNIYFNGNFSAPTSFRLVGLPSTGNDYRWVIPGKFQTSGTTKVTLQVITKSYSELGTFTLTIYVNGGGLEKFKQVSITIQATTQGG